MGYARPPVPVIDCRGRNCVNNAITQAAAPAGNGPTKNDGDMTQITHLDKLRVPLGGQEIELQQIDFVDGGMSLLRTRIREKSRFTIFDIDPLTAAQWGHALLRWAESQPRGAVAPTEQP